MNSEKSVHKVFNVKISKDGINYYHYIYEGGFFYSHETDEKIIESIKRRLEWVSKYIKVIREA